MHDLSHRLAILLLLATGVATLAGAAAAAPEPGNLALRHHQLLLALTGAALALAPWLPALRGPAIGAALLEKAALFGLALASGEAPLAPWGEAAQVLALAVAAGILLRESRREARWNGVLPLRQEG